MKLLISLSRELDPIEDALEWLSTYLQRSFEMPMRFKTSKFSLKLLRPLIDLVPYVPQDRQLYRIIGFEGQPRKKLTIPAGTLLSCTYGNTRKFWIGLADEIGASGFDNVLVMKIDGQVSEIFNTLWIQKQLVPWLQKNRPHSKYLPDIEEIGTDWQKEVVVFCDKPVVCSLAADISDEV